MFQLWFLEIPGNYTKCQKLPEICGVQESAASTIRNGWSYFDAQLENETDISLT